YFDGYYQNNYIYWPNANRNHIIGDMWNHSWETNAGWSNITYLANFTTNTNYSTNETDQVINARLNQYQTNPTTDPEWADRSIPDKKYVDDSIPLISFTVDDKDLMPTATTGDNAITDLAIANTPSGFVGVFVNGVLANLGNGDVGKDCYFSDDGGVNAKNIVDIVVGDILYWNGTIAGADLLMQNRIDFLYI
ncbi:MAG: hypothetical protein ACC656_12000, partial [Candidatus Heimdallarchaeota archaeon]